METELPDLPQNEKDEVVRKTLVCCGQILLAGMYICKCENFITGTIVDDKSGNRYELTFKKVANVHKTDDTTPL